MIRHAAVLVALALPAAAAPPEQEALFEALAVERTVALMHAESVAQGEEVAEDLYPGRGLAG